MRIALAQIDTTVGAVPANADKIIATLRRAADLGADLVVFPELAITGYPPLDLLDRPSFITHNLEALGRVAEATTSLPAAVVGYVRRDERREGKGLYNAAALLAEGRVVGVQCKTLLPTYDVFDEMRYFDPALESRPIEFQGLRIGLSICEDIWNDALFWGRLSRRRFYESDPVEDLMSAGCDLLINLAASPFTDGKRAIKRDMFTNAARRHGVPLVHVNLVGGNDNLIFDGWSNVFSAQGEILVQAADFRESLVCWDWPDGGAGTIEPTTTEGIDSVCEALTVGIRDYMRKVGFQRAIVGLSGGIDSAVTAALAVRALGADNVMGVSMPSQYSSQHSRDDAAALARNLGIDFRSVPIEPVFERYLDALEPHFEGRPFDIAEENIQARIRGNILMAFSNKFASLVLSTGNKSEMAVGYCTLYGDMSGGLAVLSDVPKTMVYRLAEFLNADTERIPQSTIDKPPSAELRPDQLDSDSLPDYETLDGIIRAYVEEGLFVDEIVDCGYDPETVRWVVRAIDRNEYKRRQAAIGLKVTHRAFGYGRRMPVARGSDV